MKDALQYSIRTNTRQGGVTLSLAGHWGNMPYDDDEAARQAARDHAGDRRYVIERHGK